jgi:hypothetical protein
MSADPKVEIYLHRNSLLKLAWIAASTAMTFPMG